MKNILYIIILSKFIWSQEMPSMKALEGIFQTSAIVDYFDGMFTHLGIIVEETGEEFTIHHNGKSIKVIKEIDGYFEYTLPKALVGIIWKGKYRGQKQKWFITRFLGKDSEINLKTKHPEFIEWKWIEPEKLPEVIVYFKKEIYLSLLKEIKLFIE